MSSSLTTPLPPCEEHIIPPLVVQEADLGEHYLLIRADNSIELCGLWDGACSGTGQVLILNHEEAYHLFISLKEVFK